MKIATISKKLLISKSTTAAKGNQVEPQSTLWTQLSQLRSNKISVSVNSNQIAHLVRRWVPKNLLNKLFQKSIHSVSQLCEVDLQ
jgi:hypothetical protein